MKAVRAPKLSRDLAGMRDELRELRAVRKHVDVELEMTFTDQWTPTGWFDADAWCRIKVDFAVAPVKGEPLRIIDIKSGKQDPKHQLQVELYALGGFLHAWPGIGDDGPDKILVELWYTDLAEVIDAEYVVAEVPALKRAWAKRTRRMLNDVKFEPRPGSHCRWCPFRAGVGGPCKYGA